MLSSEEKRYFEVSEQDYPKTNKYIDSMMGMLNKYEFDFLDLTYGYPCELVIEYVGDDIEYKYDNDFDNKNDWYEFSVIQKGIVFNKFVEALSILKDKIDCRYIREVSNYGDYEDYVCIYLKIEFLD